MLRVKVEEYHRTQAKEFVENNNVANRGEYDGGKFEQFVGRLGELIVSEALSIPLSDKKGFDDGVDIVVGNLIIDIKTKARTRFIEPWYAWNVPLSQLESDKYLSNTFLFISYVQNFEYVEVAGYITKKDYIRRALYIPANAQRNRSDGTTFYYPVPQTEITQPCLADIGNWEDLKLQQYNLIKENPNA